MKKLCILIGLFASCAIKKQDLRSAAEKEIIETDLAMSQLSTNIGFYKSLLLYAEDSVIIPKAGILPMVGKKEVASAWLLKQDFTTLTWKPFRAEASQSGDLGYSFGYATFVGKDTTTYTNYCTIWKKQTDGKWKFVYDAGNNIPKPR